MRGEKVERRVEEERDRDRIVLESENYIILGQILNSKTILILGWSEYIYIGLGWPALLGKLNQINTSIFYSPFPKKSRIHVADRFLFKMYSFMYRFSCLIMLVRISPVFPRGSYIVYFFSDAFPS